MRHNFSQAAAWVLAGLMFAGAARAEVKPHPLFTEGMVLQQGRDVPVWGTADDGEKVTVSIKTGDAKQEAQTIAKDGKWIVKLTNLPAGGPYALTIAGKNTIEFKDVLVGEVWVCSGQSNMEMHLNSCTDAPKTVADSKNPMIRLFTVPKKVATKPEGTVAAKWQECGPETAGSFSGVAYYFGRDLQKARKVPVGLIHTSWGGTPAEAWTSLPTLEADPALKHYPEELTAAIANFPKAQEKYKDDLEKYKAVVEEAKKEGKTPPPAPKAPENPDARSWRPAGLFNGMVAPLQPYAIAGVIWYQGESNAGRAYEYRTLFNTMIEDWRRTWEKAASLPGYKPDAEAGNFTFLLVQLAPWDPGFKLDEPVKDSNWAELREAQLLSTKKLKKVGEAVITDVGDAKDIHPKQKEPVGARLALAAQALQYGEKIVFSGPSYESMKVDGNKAILSFTDLGAGLEARGGTLTGAYTLVLAPRVTVESVVFTTKGGALVGFTIAGEDQKFHKAEAEIKGDKVVVWSKEVEKPVAVRYGWANYPVVNLWNKDGLPASPFRTDDFPITTGPKK